MRKIITILLLLCLSATLMQAQIVIGGHVYGGGNAGETGGNSTVTIREGDLNRVFGGARMADVKGRAFVNIDGAHASDYIVINRLYGGNDIAGTIGKSTEELPDEIKTHASNNNVDTSWNALLLISTKTNTDGTEATDAQKIYIGQLFGGGDGEYVYGSRTEGSNTVYYAKEDGVEVATSSRELTPPHIGKTFLDIHGGSIVYAYGGGNNATVTERTVISMDNPSKVVNSITDTRNPNADNTGELLTNKRFEDKMGINTTFSYPSSDAYQIGRLFGGNNKADMAIRPRWNLQRGRVRNLYGGGNEGRMTSPEGLLMQIEGEGMVIDNVYGGCRKADVKPLYNNNDETPVPYNEVALDPEDNPNNIPAGYAARVRVLAGHVNNVYGGNDISGNVYAGNTVGIMTHIYGDVYGGGNGSYAYTDNPALKNDPAWSDFYYNPEEILAAAGVTVEEEKLKSVTALNLIRPNAEKVSILVRGIDADHPTIVDGGLFVGGNSASLRENVSGSSSGNQTHIKIGSYAIIDNVYLGNNGANMIRTDEADPSGHNEGVLRTFARTGIAPNNTKFSTMDLKDKDVFAKYMEGCAMKVKSTVVFEGKANGDAVDYIPYSTMFGSLVCGGNVGSMITEGKTTINFSDKVIIYNRVVGGCNNAFVTPTDYNAIYEGGLLGAPDPAPTGSPDGTIGDKLELNFAGLKIQPKRWNTDHTALIWNTISSSTGDLVDPVTSGEPTTSTDADLDRRFDGGNIYGGCYTSGIVNGNVVININSSIIDREILFDKVEEDETGEDKHYVNDQYHIQERHSGVILSEQGMDVLGKALNVFGGGKGVNTEIWGSTTINLNRGYMFQIFGGSEEGGIGKGAYNEGTGKIEYTHDARYSTYINLNGPIAGVSRKDNMTEDIAECEFMYGGGFLGTVAGNCIINLGNGRIFDSFAGACNADVLGHTETYIGTNGFPYVRDFIYGGNDLGGQILGKANFDSRLRNDAVRSKVSNTDMLNATAYMEYVQGRVEKIFGGAYGVYDYKDDHFREYFDADGHAKTGYHKPFLENAFINFRPNDTNNPLNTVEQIYGAGQGYLGEEEEDLMQNSSYILIDVPQTMQTYQNTEIFGAGESGGVGMGVPKATADASETAHKASAIIDLLSGHFKAVYGGSYQEGVTRRTVINVPEGSTFRAEAIFGGAYGLYNEYPCDVYEANVNWNSSDALVGGYRTGLYGGNNNCRRTFYGRVNVNAPVYYDKANKYYATVYGAGYGKDTWSQYTEVNLNNNARVYEVYGGGQLGRVMNKKSVDAWAAEADAAADVEAAATSTTATHIDLSIGTGYTDNGLNDALATARNGKKYNTNVIINEGADVCGYMYNGSRSGAYAYGGGLGDANTPNTGDVHGTTYIALLGGKVTKDLYAAGTVGSVNNKYNIATDDFDQSFIASANAYVEGGTARNVYGGGWRGSVGYHAGAIDASTTGDILGETHVVIGKLDGTSFVDGIPAIERNAYGGGEGGAVFGTANITLNKGYIGYRHFTAQPTDGIDYIQVGSDYYQEKLHDETWSGDGTNRLYDSGCVFGGGYIDNSSVDVANVKMYGGVVRNALFGGGEIAAIGRGVIEASGTDNSVRTLKGIYKAGRSSVELFEGQVHRNVFGGGRGYNNLGEGGTLYSDGYVFGQTEVHVHGGTVGTAKELARENGNVFGGGDIGYVYSAYEQDGKLYVGIKDGDRYDDKYEGYYYAYDLEKNDGPKSYIPADFVYNEYDPKWVMDNGEYVLTEDCKVLIEPYCKALSDITVNGHNYAAGSYVTTTDLHTLGNKQDATWNNLDLTGITIFNAVFAGGNTSSGSSTVYANSTTVFGNATASIHDVYHRDLITLGTGRTGGLYGDGNLTFVDGYRGLNITNYGTDYYSLDPEIDYSTYEQLPPREADYYQLKYKCIEQCTDKDGTTYYPEGGEHTKASTLTIDDLLTLFEGIKVGNDDILLINSETGEYYPNPAYWEQNGVVPVYAGRLMNTIQRADFCGVFGSRMVMQGAQDRVPEIVDHTNYTINRVREVSLNQKQSVRTADASDEGKKVHGNYFGIYSIVNYLGALTSDVFFMPDKDIRVTDNASNLDYKTASKAYNNGGSAVASNPYGTATFYDWKAGFVNDRKRNNGTSKNKVALASGVYLELTTEKSTGDDLYQKDWGYITGVIELDLINVQPGMGGGFVYAKNVHKTGTYTKHNHNTLTALNNDAITRRDFTYTGADVEWETSGNFIHSTQTIIDDCYNVSGRYSGTDAVPAHYWFIKGSVYVYDQYISAYTGAPNAYSETVDIPLTITAASHGTMKLLNVMPNKYAYWSAPGVKLEEGKKIVINDVEYHLNDPINYWDWYLLTSSEKNLFVDETYVTIADCKYSSEDATLIPAGTVMLPADYNTLKTAHPTVYHVEKQQNVPFEFVYRPSNNMSHDTGYMLTYKVNNPTDWDTWYTKYDSSTQEKNQTGGAGYEDGPTYRLKNSSTGGVLGQREYKVSNLIAEDVYTSYQTMKANHSEAIPTTGQATFEGAYIVTSEYTSGDVHLNVGSSVSATQAATMTGYVAPAYICTSTIQLSKTEFIYVGNRMTEDEKTAYYNTYKDANPALAAMILEDIVPAYYCTVEGLYGGNYYEANKNYRGLEVWSSMSKEDREKFTFNYDALDILIDPRYGWNAAGTSVIYPEGQKYEYDSADGDLAGAESNLAHYSLQRPVNYTATYNGSATSTHNGVTLAHGHEYSREQYEKLPNEKRHYTTIDVKDAGNVYVVKAPFQVGNTPYAVGTVISANTYSSLGQSDQANVTTLTFTEAQKNKTYYYCREQYTVGENTDGVEVAGVEVTGGVSGTYSNGQTVPVGLVITEGNFNSLPNYQTDFSIHGIAPTETSTLYVSRFSDIFDLSKEKIITVIYEYNYEESDVSGTHVTPVSERHVVNIHVQFKSGIPTVEDIKAPQVVLPGTFVGVREPHVTPGAYEVTGGGWKLFEKKSDAESHINGVEYTPTADPLYWYQHGYYLAYYAKTYLGETYSNTVQVSVANYHDLKKVLDDTSHHYYVDNPTVQRNSKIYINDATNGATQLKQFFDLSKSTLDEHVRDCQNLEFILHTNVTVPSGSPTWTPIGDATHCFSGNFHGDGYRIDGLDHSLFGHLCGNVYNLGVTGSFTSAGVADTGDGYVENCWINTTASSGFPAGVKAVFGNPTGSGYKRVNCYYPNTLTYDTSDDHHGMARPMPANAFYNGTVAYDLNGFYLFKRYNDHLVPSGSPAEYKYYAINKEDGTLTEPQTQHYAANAEYCSSGVNGVYLNGGYVEDRYGDGDFRYADGNIPENEDQRTLVDADGVSHFYPIWPDDYLYFGQMLTYSWNNQRPHENVPSHIVKNSSRLPNTDESNRVYRAPAYYQSKVMDVAHFNPAVNLVAYSKPKNANDTDLNPAYPNMTAIDFAGHNDNSWTIGRVTSSSPAGVDKFYQPLLDDDGLQSITNRDETNNLLVYAPSAQNNEQTNGVLNAYFTDPSYADSYQGSPYRCVTVSTGASTVNGHLVQSNLTATSDHLLIDKQDFNCPISYTFATGKRMWYQRTPDLFVDLTKGWETVSLPFTAELVSTQDKGEITHFYSKSRTADGSADGAKIGHEYWLREYEGIGTAPSGSPAGVLTAAFNYPTANGNTKTVGNTFLWDYYYSENGQQDANADTYQTYYEEPRDLPDYPLLTTAEPYIIGFPGKTYYEFDLSGQWTPKNTATTAPAQLAKQTISFVSETGITIGVSDDELISVDNDNYAFVPNYTSKKVDGYLMNADGNSFDVTPAGGAMTVPFRPYFIASGSGAHQYAHILFDSNDSSFAFGDDKDPSGDNFGEGDLLFTIRKHMLSVTSSLRREADVRIVNMSGLTIATFTIQPGETVNTNIGVGGVYMVRADGGRIQKKLAIK
ncbi:MAG: hypothetical protein J6T05_02925 [Prevotella sp.]|nr:hypothetical protein [Prevotella sp.]